MRIRYTAMGQFLEVDGRSFRLTDLSPRELRNAIAQINTIRFGTVA